jgi:hypothetical protein
MHALPIEDLWAKDAHSESGLCLGRIAAVGTGGGIGHLGESACAQEEGGRPQFLSLTSARLDRRRAVVSSEPALGVLQPGCPER